MTYADALAPFIQAGGVAGFAVIFFLTYLWGDWLRKPRPGDLPHRFGCVVRSIDEDRKARVGWLVATVTTALLAAAIGMGAIQI